MSRILVVGMGVPTLVDAPRHAGPGLRSAHFARVLAADGHDVLLVAVVGEDDDVPASVTAAGVAIEFTTERELLAPTMRARVDGFGADAVVGVTVYAASLAVRLGLGRPLWADVFGDILAEAQAKAARSGNDWSIVHFWTLLRGVLEGADRFSAVSRAQAHALVGQLGLAGRLSLRTAGEDLVATIPCAAEVPAALPDRSRARAELGFGGDDFVLLASGGVNTWFDVETFCRAVALAMQADPRIRLVVTGGAIPGHDEASHPALVAGLRGVDASRVRILGWIDSRRLATVYAATDLAVLVERRLYERRLGAENRVVEWLAHGLAVMTTACSESGEELASLGLARTVPPGDDAALARALVDAARALRREADAAAECAGGETKGPLSDSTVLAALGVRGRDWVRSERSPAGTAEPLRKWCASPRFAGDQGGPRLVRIGLLSHPGTSLEMLEAYVASLGFAEVARRGVRWTWRRTSSATVRLLSRSRFRA